MSVPNLTPPLRRSPRLAEKAAKKTPILAEKIEKKPIETDVLTKENLKKLRFHAAFMGLLYKYFLSDYKNVVEKLCATMETLLTKSDPASILYRNYLYTSLKQAVEGHLFYHPDDIVSVKKMTSISSIEYIQKGTQLVTDAGFTKSCGDFTVNSTTYSNILHHFIDNPILISQYPTVRNIVFHRVKLFETYISEKHTLDSYDNNLKTIMNAYVTFSLLPLRDDFVM